MGQRPVLGIDLGTTYSCVARLDEYGRPEVLQNLDGELTTASVVYFEPDAPVVVGDAAKNELRREPGRVVELIKRHMGEDGYTVEIDGESYLPQRISAIILRSVVEGALTAAGEGVSADGPLADVVITVPAYFGTPERQATRDAGQMAGLSVLNIINEPTAAALAYDPKVEGPAVNVLVYDLGGGTFDVTVIRRSADEVRTIATDGNHHLGGADWDAVMQDLLAEKYAAVHPGKGDPRTDETAAGELSVLAEAAKRSLSTKETYRTSVTAHGERAPVEVKRAEFEDVTAHLVDQTLDYTRRILEEAATRGVDRFDALLLVGGMSRSPVIARRLAETFPQLPPARLMDPDLIVAKGAALYAAAFGDHELRESEGPAADGGQTGARSRFLPTGLRIVNVSSKGYGVHVVDAPDDRVGHVAWLIRPNDALPCAPQETFRTVHPDQTSVAVRVFESLTSELDDAVDRNTELIDGVLEGLPPRQPAGQPVDVDLALGDDGILHIHARSGGRDLRLDARISGSTPPGELSRPLPPIQH
jgi:molecular chaperone DnaK